MGEHQPEQLDQPEQPTIQQPRPPKELRTPEPTLSRWMIIAAVLLWVGAAVVGTMGQSVPGLDREAFFSYEGEPVDRCFGINPAAYEADNSVGNFWCTPTKVLGAALPEDIDVAIGDIEWGEVGFSDFVDSLGQPSFWFTIGVGGAAMLVFGAFARRTGTVRAGLAAAVSVVFLGLLLFPISFTGQVAADMRLELVSAWKWVIVFYFGSEAAVAAAKIWNMPRTEGDAPAIQGDFT